MSVGAIIGGVAALAGGAMSANAASSAARTSAAASQAASDAQMRMYEQTRSDLQPQREAQRYVLDALLSMTGLPALRGEPKAVPAPNSPAPGIGDRPTNPAFWTGAIGGVRGRPRYSGTGLDAIQGMGMDGNGGYSGLEYQNLPSLADMLAERAPQARMLGGPIQEGGRYNVSEIGHPEGIYDTAGNLQNVTTSPQTITAQQDGYVAPLAPNQYGAPTTSPQPTGLPGIAAGSGAGYNGLQTLGAQIPGSTVHENPGGQDGRYNFMTDPGYSFRFDEGQRAIERSASARGMGLSGGILRELARYGQGIGSAEYGNVYNRISNIAGLGQTGQSLTAQAGMQTGAAQAGYLQDAGNANAAGTLGRASAYGDTLGQLARLYGQYTNQPAAAGPYG